jgi:hypothetical protein
VPTSKRPQITDVQYPRIPSKILKDATYEEVVNDVVDEVAMSGVNDEARNMLVLNVWSVEHPDILHSCKESGGATRGMPTLGRSQVYSAQEPGSTW